MNRRMLTLALAAAIVATPPSAAALAHGSGAGQAPCAPPRPSAAAPARQDEPRVAQMKKDAAADVDAMKRSSPSRWSTVFSFSELGFQEVET